MGSHGDAAVIDRACAGAEAVFWLAPADPAAPSAEAAYDIAASARLLLDDSWRGSGEVATRRGAQAPYGVGAVRDHLWPTGRSRERITLYDPPYATEYVVDRSLPPSRHELGRMTVTEVDGGTHVRWTTRAEIPVPVIGTFLTRRLARPVITRTFRNLLDAADSALAGRR